MSATKSQETFIERFSEILTSNNDPNFKLVRILETNDKLFVDIRETTKGRFSASSNGICFFIPEFEWVSHKVKSCDNPKFCLEYGQRELDIFKDCDGISLKLTKGNKTTNLLELTEEEYQKFKLLTTKLDSEIQSIARKRKIDIKINPKYYYNENKL